MLPYLRRMFLYFKLELVRAKCSIHFLRHHPSNQFIYTHCHGVIALV